MASNMSYGRAVSVDRQTLKRVIEYHRAVHGQEARHAGREDQTRRRMLTALGDALHWISLMEGRRAPLDSDPGAA